MKAPEAPISTPPQAYMDIIGPLIGKAKELLEAGEKLQPFAFVGNLSTRQTVAVTIQSGSHDDKDRSAREIKAAALAIEGDFVFVIMEAWALRPDKVAFHAQIIDKYGSVGASPFAIDTCSFMLETRRGMWVSQPQIKPKGISKKKRTIGDVVFRFYTEVGGRFTELLPIKAGEDAPSILH